MLPEINQTNSSVITVNKMLSFSQKYPVQILVAEDDLLNRKIMTHLMHKLGYENQFAENGTEVIEAIHRHTFQLILMDLHMPEMNGIETTHIIRSDADIVQPIIVAMTASGFKDDHELCLEAGMDDYINKPVILNELMSLIKKWYGQINTAVQ